MARRTSLLMIVLALAVVVGCSDEDTNQVPEVIILEPEDGHHFTSDPGMVTIAVNDDGNWFAEILLDDGVIATLRDTTSTRLPLGLYADGEPHTIEAYATDYLGARGTASPVTVTIDPSLQTVPQIIELAAQDGEEHGLRLVWLEFPGTEQYRYEVARTDAFESLLVSGLTTATSTALPLPVASLAYVRIQARHQDGGVSDWSRTRRYDGTEAWRQQFPLAGPQVGTGVIPAADGTIRLLSYGLSDPGLESAMVQIVTLAEDRASWDVLDVLDASYQVRNHVLTDDRVLLLGGVRTVGAGFLAAVTLDGDMVWRRAVHEFDPSAIFTDGAGQVLAAGRDRRAGQPGGVVASIDMATGTVAITATFALEVDRFVTAAWPASDGGSILAGRLPETDDGAFGGVWVRGVGSGGAVEWDLVLGIEDRWLPRGYARDDAGNLLLTGIAHRGGADERAGFLVCLDDRGHFRWQITDSDWLVFTAAVADGTGRWTVAGARRKDIDGESSTGNAALQSFSSEGEPLWEVPYADGLPSQAWSVAPHPDGGWLTAGFVKGGGGDFDLDLLRVDDRGAFD